MDYNESVCLLHSRWILHSTKFEQSYRCCVRVSLTLFSSGWGKKRPPTSFPPVTSTNEGISLQNFLIVSFNPIATLV